ncbi:hypothetical protein EU523_01145 [Candidatus Heimdallarchaeota archaeon]|nr:MAG: hypothetical protein EU523_01145 [Candidatus Heimdallarchaeota archaeon]
MNKQNDKEKDEEKIKPALKIQLKSLTDLIRMAFFNAARNHGLNFLFFKDKEKDELILGFLTGVSGYYKLWGVPMFFYVPLEKEPKNMNFIKYSSKEEIEKWEFTKSTREVTKWNYLPVIQLAEKPIFF